MIKLKSEKFKDLKNENDTRELILRPILDYFQNKEDYIIESGKSLDMQMGSSRKGRGEVDYLITTKIKSLYF